MNSGDVVEVDFGTPIGPEASFVRPAVIVVANAFLRYQPTTVFAVPLTSSQRSFPSHVPIDLDAYNGLVQPSVALVEQMRAIAVQRCSSPLGNIGAVANQQILDVLAMITGMP